MKTSQSNYRHLRGNTYVVVMVAAAIAGTVLAAYLKMVGTQNSFTMRSQSWNRCISVTEAGVEEGLTHLYRNGRTNVAFFKDGWINVYDWCYKQGRIDDGFYSVFITNIQDNPVIMAQGTVPYIHNYAGDGLMIGALTSYDSQDYIKRTIRVETLAEGVFANGMTAKYWINFNGGIVVDSYDSRLNDGLYSPAVSADRGIVACNSGLTNYDNIAGNGIVKVYGRARSGPQGVVDMSGNASLGSTAWVNGGGRGVEPGRFRDDMNMQFPSVGEPFSGNYLIPGSGTVGGEGYALVLSNANNGPVGATSYWKSASINLSGDERALITGGKGDVIWWVTDGIKMSGQSQLIVSRDVRLYLYVGRTSGSGVSSSIAGQGVINMSMISTNFVYYGLPSNTSIDMSGNAAFAGVIYAPSAAFKLSGGGNDEVDFMGASVTATVTQSGKYRYHYDEALRNFGLIRSYAVTNWIEL